MLWAKKCACCAKPEVTLLRTYAGGLIAFFCFPGLCMQMNLGILVVEIFTEILFLERILKRNNTFMQGEGQL